MLSVNVAERSAESLGWSCMGRLAGSEVLTSYWNEEQFRKELKEICHYTVIARQKGGRSCWYVLCAAVLVSHFQPWTKVLEG